MSEPGRRAVFVTQQFSPGLSGHAPLADDERGHAPLADDDELPYPMPTKVYEPLGCGLPIVSTGTGELGRFLEASGGGLHADNGPAALDELLDDPELRATCGRDGLAYERLASRLDHQLGTLVSEAGR